MVAHLSPSDMDLVVRGEARGHRSRGRAGCKLMCTPKYDHKRAFAAKSSRAPMPPPGSWEFVLLRDDDSVVCLHPSLKRK